MTKTNDRLLAHASVLFDELCGCTPLPRPVVLALDPGLEGHGALGKTTAMKNGDLLIGINPCLLKPSMEMSRQLIHHVLLHEMAHAADWESLRTPNRRAHDVFWGIHYSRLYQAMVKE